MFVDFKLLSSDQVVAALLPQGSASPLAEVTGTRLVCAVKCVRRWLVLMPGTGFCAGVFQHQREQSPQDDPEDESHCFVVYGYEKLTCSRVVVLKEDLISSLHSHLNELCFFAKQSLRGLDTGSCGLRPDRWIKRHELNILQGIA